MHKAGFTLVEILVVLAIVSLLASIVVSSTNAAREKARINAGLYFATNLDHVIGDQAGGMWNFDDCSGSSVSDRSGNNNSGTLTGAVWSTDTPTSIGCSLLFDGVSANINVPYASSLNTNVYSFSLWAKPTSSADGYILSSRYVGDTASCPTVYGTNGFYVGQVGGVWILTMGTTASWKTISGKPAVVGKWSQLAGTFDGTTARFFNDGVLVASLPYSGFTYCPNVARNTGIGSIRDVAASNFFAGYIDNVRIYSKSM